MKVREWSEIVCDVIEVSLMPYFLRTSHLFAFQRAPVEKVPSMERMELSYTQNRTETKEDNQEDGHDEREEKKEEWVATDVYEWISGLGLQIIGLMAQNGL